MKTLAELQQERAEKVKAQSTMVTEARTAKADFTDEQTTRFDALTGEIENLDKAIERAKAIEASEKRAADLNGQVINEPKKEAKEGGEAAEKRKIMATASVTRAIATVSSGQALEGAEKEMSELAVQESRDAGVKVNPKALLHIPMSMLRATAQTVTEDGGNYGGQLVGVDAPKVFMPFQAKTVLEKLGATRWTGLQGDVPLVVGNNYNFEWLAETAPITPQKQRFDGAVLSPKRLGAAVEISNQLLIQSSINVEATIRRLLFNAYDRAINEAAINGAGGLEPLGILNTPGVQQSSTVAGAAPTRAMLIELPALIEAANATESSLGFLMSPGVKAALQNTKVDEGSGLFLMDGNDNVIGFKVVTSTLVPELTGNQAVIFGDWSQLFIGEWGSMSVLSDPYSASLSNSVRLVINGHADVGVAQPDAFAVNKFITI